MKQQELIYTNLDDLKTFIINNKLVNSCLADIFSNNKIQAAELTSELRILNADININTVISSKLSQTTISFTKIPDDAEIISQNSSSELDFFHAGPVVIFRRKMQDDCWVVTHVTQSVSQWGYEPNSFINNKEAIKTVFYNDDVEQVKETLIRSIQAGNNKINQQYRIYKSDGTVAWISDYTQIIRDDTGQAIELIGYLLDTTQDKANESLYEGIINTTTEGFWLLDSKFKIIDVNASLCTMLGYTKDEILGKNSNDFITEDPYQLCDQEKMLTEDNSNSIYEISFIGKDGCCFHVLTNSTTIYDPDGNKKTFAFMTDISNQKKTQEDLRQHRDEIEELNSSLESKIRLEVEKNREKEQMMYQQSRLASMGEMIGNIAHQWRQPLNIMALVMQDLYISDQLGNLTSKKIEDSYEKSNNLLQYMSQTIDDFRNFFKQGDADQEFSIKEALDSVYSLINTNLSYHHIECSIDVQKDNIVKGGQNEFKQVLINIINNAQEAIESNNSKTKKIDILITQEDNQAIIRISDDGGGMKNNVIDKIFDPYFTTKNQTQGTGLGLYMSKQIIENSMCGSLTTQNTEKGAEFAISLSIK